MSSNFGRNILQAHQHLCDECSATPLLALYRPSVVSALPISASITQSPAASNSSCPPSSRASRCCWRRLAFHELLPKDPPRLHLFFSYDFAKEEKLEATASALDASWWVQACDWQCFGSSRISETGLDLFDAAPKSPGWPFALQLGPYLAASAPRSVLHLHNWILLQLQLRNCEATPWLTSTIIVNRTSAAQP